MQLFPRFAEELIRKETFDTWTNSIDINIMVESGLFFLNSHDLVQCFSCGIKLSCWKKSHIPDVEHLQYSPNCLFIQHKVLSAAVAKIKLTFSLLKEISSLKAKIDKLEKYIDSPKWSINSMLQFWYKTLARARNQTFLM